MNIKLENLLVITCGGITAGGASPHINFCPKLPWALGRYTDIWGATEGEAEQEASFVLCLHEISNNNNNSWSNKNFFFLQT